METNFTTSEITLILKSMFVLLSDNFYVTDEDTSFLNEVASMSNDFHLIDFHKQIGNWEKDYNHSPEMF